MDSRLEQKLARIPLHAAITDVFLYHSVRAVALEALQEMLRVGFGLEQH
jgi:hypothetical protein